MKPPDSERSESGTVHVEKSKFKQSYIYCRKFINFYFRRRSFEDQNGIKKKPRHKGREGREPELILCTDPKFRYWNLPAKAKVLLVSNVPEVGL